MSTIPEPFAKAPGGAIGRIASKVNALITWAHSLSNLQAGAGIKITRSKKNILISAIPPEEGGGGGVPDGYEETEVVICDRATNTAVEGSILFRPDA